MTNEWRTSKKQYILGPLNIQFRLESTIFSHLIYFEQFLFTFIFSVCTVEKVFVYMFAYSKLKFRSSSCLIVGWLIPGNFLSLEFQKCSVTKTSTMVHLFLLKSVTYVHQPTKMCRTAFWTKKMQSKQANMVQIGNT